MPLFRRATLRPRAANKQRAKNQGNESKKQPHTQRVTFLGRVWWTKRPTPPTVATTAPPVVHTQPSPVVSSSATKTKQSRPFREESVDSFVTSTVVNVPYSSPTSPRSSGSTATATSSSDECLDTPDDSLCYSASLVSMTSPRGLDPPADRTITSNYTSMGPSSLRTKDASVMDFLMQADEAYVRLRHSNEMIATLPSCRTHLDDSVYDTSFVSGLDAPTVHDGTSVAWDGSVWSVEPLDAPTTQPRATPGHTSDAATDASLPTRVARNRGMGRHEPGVPWHAQPNDPEPKDPTDEDKDEYTDDDCSATTVPRVAFLRRSHSPTFDVSVLTMDPTLLTGSPLVEF